MTPGVFVLLTFLASVGAGLLGALLGLGGGIIIIPALTLFLGMDIHYAMGASIVSVIATSSGAAAAYVRDRITNLRIGMFLQMATTTGAIMGAFLNGLVSPRLLYAIFGVMLAFSAVGMFQKRKEELPQAVPDSRAAARLRLEGEYYDGVLRQRVKYRATGVGGGFAMMYVAGLVSGLLGIGSGLFKVIAMDLFMQLPLKVSTATSNFMIGVTAAASAGVYFAQGYINPLAAAPVALGVLLGALWGTRVMTGTRSTTLRKIFIPLILYVAVEMLLKGLGWSWR